MAETERGKGRPAKYTPEQEEFLKAYIPYHTEEETYYAFLEKFPDMADKVGRSFVKNYGLRTGCTCGSMKQISEWEQVTGYILERCRPKKKTCIVKRKEPKIIKEAPHGYIW